MTIREIAKMANVSPAAISLVINNKPGISDSKRKEILTLLDKLNYTKGKRGKDTQQTSRSLLFLKYIKTGFLVEENAGFISKILDAVEQECSKLNYTLRIQVEKNSLASAINALDFSTLDGLLVIGTEIESAEYNVLNKIKVPYVVIDNSMPNFSCHSITMANEEMVNKAVTLLASLDEGPIGYIHSLFEAQNFTERSNGFYATIKNLGRQTKEEYTYLLEPTLKGSYVGMQEYIKKGATFPSLVFADNDTLAIGSMRALSEAGYKIPQDIQIVGFDDIYLSATSAPPLTTLHVQRTMIGCQAVRLLHEVIEMGSAGNIKVKIGSDFIFRESTKSTQ